MIPLLGWTCAGPKQEQGNEGRSAIQALQQLGHGEVWQTLANQHPPVEPTWYHRGSPTVAGEGSGTRPHDQAEAEARSSPSLRASPRIPSMVSIPHHSEVTRPWAAVGVSVGR